MKNLYGCIHNRCSTLCQAYVKEFYPEVWLKLRAKAEHDYEHRSARMTIDEVKRALNPPVDPNNPYNDPGFVS